MTERPLPNPLFTGERPLLVVGLESTCESALNFYAHGTIEAPDSVSIGQLHGETPPETDGVTALPLFVRPYGGPIRISALTSGVTVHETESGARLAVFRNPVCTPNQVFTHLIVTDDDGDRGDLMDRLTVAIRRRGIAGAYPILAEIDGIVRRAMRPIFR